MSTPDDASETRQHSRIDRRRREAREQPSESYLRRRRELEFAAAAVMRRKGFRDMTLRDLADEVGAERASIYYYVAGKEDLLADMVLRALLENHEALEQVLARPEPAADRIRGCIRVLMGQFDRHFPYLYIWVHEDLSRFEGIDQETMAQIVDLSQREFEFIESLVVEGVAAGEFVTSLPSGVVAQSIIGLVAWTFRWYEPGHTLSAEQLADGLADITLRGLISPDARLRRHGGSHRSFPRFSSGEVRRSVAPYAPPGRPPCGLVIVVVSVENRPSPQPSASPADAISVIASRGELG